MRGQPALSGRMLISMIEDWGLLVTRPGARLLGNKAVGIPKQGMHKTECLWEIVRKASEIGADC